MGPCPTPEVLRRLLAEKLDDTEREQVTGHVDACADCRQRLDALTNDVGHDLISRLRVRPEEPVPLRTVAWPRPPTEPRPSAWPRLAGYDLLGELGSGGMGTVYKARQLAVNRLVAIKVVRQGLQAYPEELARFRLEGEILARVQHPNVVAVYDVGIHDGQPYCVTEYVEGGTLHAWMQTAQPSALEATGLVETLARAAHAAHLCGIVHRDLKPANILLASAVGRPQSPASAHGLAPTNHGPRTTDQGLVPKITDFGLAKSLTDGRRLTVTGQVMGTPSYMAPEQATGDLRAISPRTDVYALGTILYELLAGRLPFEGKDPTAVLLQVVHEEPPPIRRFAPQVARDLETICLKCLRKEPSQRYASAAALAEDLRRYRAGEPIGARPASLWERSRKWTQRRPALALLLATLCASALAMLGLILRHSARLQDALEQTQIERDKATGQERLTRRALYAAQLNLAQQALGQEQIDIAIDLLESQRPTPERPEDLRGFEWYHLWRRCHQERALLFASPVNVRAAAWIPSGLRLVLDGQGAATEVWDVSMNSGQFSSPKRVLTVPVVLPPHRDLALSSDGRLLAVPGGFLQLWDVASAQELFPGHWPTRRSSVAFAPDNKTLAVGDEDGTVTLWDVSTRPHPTQRQQYRPHQTAVSMLVFSPDGKDLLSCAYRIVAGQDWPDRIAKLCQVATGQERGSILTTTSNSKITNVAYSPDGKTMALTQGLPFNHAAPGKLQLLDATNLKELASRSIPGGGTFAVAFSPDGKLLAMGETSGAVRLWQVAADNGQTLVHEPAVLYGHRGRVLLLGFAPDGKGLVSASDDQTVRLWQLPPRSEPALLTKQAEEFRALAFTPTGRTLATTVEDTRLLLWDLTTRQPRSGPPLFAHFEAGCIPAFAPDGKLVAAPQSDGTVKIWEVSTGRLQATLKGHEKVVNGTAFHPEGQLLATAGRDRTVKFWDVRTGQELATLRGHTRTVWSVAFTPDGRTLTSGSDDGKVKFWDVDTKQCRSTLEGPARTMSGIMALAFTPDGTMLAAGTYDGRLKLWDLIAGTEHLLPQRHVGAITSAVFTPDGQTLLTASKDGTIKFWDVVTKEERLTFKGHTDEVHGIALTADGETLISASADGTILLWHAPRATTASSRP